MKFLLDPDVPDEVAQWLKHVGHEMTLLREALSTQAADDRLWYSKQTCVRVHT